MGFALFALLIGSNGCMTQSAIQYAKGQPDQAWINNNFGYYGTEPDPNSTPHAGYYILVPLAAPVDVVTSPFQLIDLGFCAFLTGFNKNNEY